MCGSVFGIRIRIHKVAQYWSNLDGNPQYWLNVVVFFNSVRIFFRNLDWIQEYCFQDSKRIEAVNVWWIPMCHHQWETRVRIELNLLGENPRPCLLLLLLLLLQLLPQVFITNAARAPKRGNLDLYKEKYKELFLSEKKFANWRFFWISGKTRSSYSDTFSIWNVCGAEQVNKERESGVLNTWNKILPGI